MNYSDKRVLIVDDQRPFLTLLRGVVNNMGAVSYTHLTLPTTPYV